MKLIVFSNRYLKIDGFLVWKIDRKSFSWVLNFFKQHRRKKSIFFICVAFPLLNYWTLYGTSEGVGVLGRLFLLLASSSASSPINFIKLAPHTLHFSQVEFLCDVACGWIRINKAEKKIFFLHIC
jgi:hypothetical protein